MVMMLRDGAYKRFNIKISGNISPGLAYGGRDRRRDHERHGVSPKSRLTRHSGPEPSDGAAIAAFNSGIIVGRDSL
jgi:hypothetical protein